MIPSATVRAFRDHYAGRPDLVIRSLAQRMLDDAGQTKPPFRMTSLLSLCQVPLHPRIEIVDTPFDGYIYQRDGRYSIAVNAHHPLERQRFSIAHELGHTFFLPFRDTTRLRAASTVCGNLRHHQDPVEERLCNMFASELLMPERYFGPDIGNRTIHPDLVVELARRYQASIRAVSLRLCELIGDKAVIIALCQEPNQGPAAEVNAVWSARSRKARGLGKYRIVIPSLSADFGERSPRTATVDFDNGRRASDIPTGAGIGGRRHVLVAGTV